MRGRLREAGTRLEHLATVQKTITAPADRLPARASAPDLPEHPDPRVLAFLNGAAGPLRARDICEAPDHELMPKDIEGTRAKLKRPTSSCACP